MSYSCSDFADDLLEQLGNSGLLREDDVPSDDPGRQAELALHALATLVEIKNLAEQLVAAVRQAPSKTEGELRLASDVEQAIGRLLPRYLVADGYSHCFVGSKATETRWVMDLNSGQIVAAQGLNRRRWEDLHRSEVADLLEDVAQTNAVRENPGDFGAELASELPEWARG